MIEISGYHRLSSRVQAWLLAREKIINQNCSRSLKFMFESFDYYEQLELILLANPYRSVCQKMVYD